MKMHKAVVFLVFLMAFLLRVVGIGQFPGGFTPDEASFGYDAYSILKTGRDQWGVSLPIVLKSFGDDKLPLYSYLAIPSVAALGLNEFATRLPNALFGFLAVVMTFFLTKKIVFQREHKDDNQFFDAKYVPILAAFLLAISPWHVPLSRGAFEANLTTFFLTGGIYFFLKGLEKKDSYAYPIAAMLFGLNFFTYHSARFVTPLIVLALLFIFRKDIKASKSFIISGLLGFVFVLLLAYSMLSGAGSRISSASVFSLASQAGAERYQAQLGGMPSTLSLVFYNKVAFIGEKIARQYLSYFTPEFLVLKGPGEGTYGMLPGEGVLYLIEIVSLVTFVYFFLKGKIRGVGWLVFWILVAPIPAALSVGPGGAANRAAIMMPAIQIASAIGFYYLINSFELKKSFKYIPTFIVVSVLLFSGVNYFQKYFYLQSIKEGQAMFYGVSELFKNIDDSDYSRVVISKNISEAHMFVAFYKKIDPRIFQESSKSWDMKAHNVKWVDQLPEYTLGSKYEIKSIDWVADGRRPNVLLVGRPRDLESSGLPATIITYKDFSPAFVIFNTENFPI